MKRKALGRGLSALIPETSSGQRNKDVEGDNDYFVCPIEWIKRSTNQPRSYFDEERLAELVSSIREHGMVQPLVVRPGRQHNSFVLVAGERRWRAAQKAGLHEVPVVIRRVTDAGAYEMALVENIQREDLNPIEEAEAYQHLIDQHGHSQEKLAERVGKDRSTIANSLRLLKLPERCRRAVAAAEISSGHARALLALDSAKVQVQALREVIKRKLSVRETERLVKLLQSPQNATKKSGGTKSANIRDLERKLVNGLKTRVVLDHKRSNSGRITIHYASLDELDRLLEVLLR